jgi:GNAT superfamily N-acetyltransferase
MGRDEGRSAADLDPLIRRASAADGDALAELRWLWQVGARGETGMSRAEFGTEFLRWLHDHRDSHVSFLAELDDVAVGMAWLATIERVPGPVVWRRLAGSLQSLFVAPSHRGRGLGSALAAAVIAEATERGLDYVIVHPSQRSFPLYRRLGFRETGGMLEVDLRPKDRPS